MEVDMAGERTAGVMAGIISAPAAATYFGH